MAGGRRLQAGRWLEGGGGWREVAGGRGGWLLAGGRWLEVGRLVSGWQQVAGGRCLEAGGWRRR